jgi:hypothetical protein
MIMSSKNQVVSGSPQQAKSESTHYAKRPLWKKVVGISAILGALYIGTTASANTTLPGSVDDPLITKSYLDEQVAKIKSELLTQLGQAGGSAGTPGTPEIASTLVVEKLETGQSLIAGAGTEFIVRTGHAVGIMSKDGNGIPNVTDGTDIKGTKVPLNNLLLFPRDDGRGIKVIKGPSHIMIRGSYEIIK